MFIRAQPRLSHASACASKLLQRNCCSEKKRPEEQKKNKLVQTKDTTECRGWVLNPDHADHQHGALTSQTHYRHCLYF